MANVAGTAWQKVQPCFGAPPIWMPIGNFAQGVKGDKGDTGKTGQQGQQGPIGPSGITVTLDRLTNDFRLTLLSGTAIPTTDQTAAATLYLTPKLNIGGTAGGTARIVLYNGSAHIEYFTGEVSVSVASKTPGMYDVFAVGNQSNGTVSIETLAWNTPSSAAITTATNATPIVITSNGHGLSADQVVFIEGCTGNTAANGTWRVGTTTANTFQILNMDATNTTGSGAGSTGTWYRLDANVTRATAIDLQDGVWYKHGDLTRRYVGSFRVVKTGEINDSAAKRCLWNAYNRVPRQLLAQETTSSWNYTTATLRPANNNMTIGKMRVQVAIGQSVEAILMCVYQPTFNASNPFADNGIGINSNTVNSAICGGADAIGGQSGAVYNAFPGVGQFDFQQLEQSSVAGTTTWYGSDSGFAQQALYGSHWC